MKLSIKLDEEDWLALADLIQYYEVNGPLPTSEEFPHIVEARITAHSIRRVVRDSQEIRGVTDSAVRLGFRTEGEPEEPRQSIWSRTPK